MLTNFLCMFAPTCSVWYLYQRLCANYASHLKYNIFHYIFIHKYFSPKKIQVDFGNVIVQKIVLFWYQYHFYTIFSEFDHYLTFSSQTILVFSDVFSCVPMITTVNSYLPMFNTTCALYLLTPCLIVFNYVYLCFPLFTHAYLCLQCLLVCTYDYHCYLFFIYV